MVPPDAFRDQPTLHTARIRLEPLTAEHFDGIWAMVREPEVARLTGAHQPFTEAGIRGWLTTRADHHDRADWAVVRVNDGVVIGDVAFNGFDPDNASTGFRIALAGPHVFGHGYGTEATRLAVDYALDTVGLHRVELEVFSFNPRARRVYEKCGFVREGVRRDALYWAGARYDAIVMAVLSTDPRPR
ncbi:GNAT family N-acetyltransferase [Spiractinospora alimapuensis]|nr:GNAT family protein [Spiractinospora alimapuensis]QVQ54616.1 GNAT family N-acetyltransferase [Spiractinospora alimapuensis]